MKHYRADLHIHTVLSPCGDLEMSPANILRIAAGKQLDIIGITDHNTTRQAAIIKNYGQEHQIFVLMGAEITTSEEVHCLAFFSDETLLNDFQAYLDKHLPPLPNNPEKFGFQVAVDWEDNIIFEEEKMLISALDQNMDEIEKKVRELNGIFIPAHIDKKRFSILSQLGFIPPKLQYDALELSRNTTYRRFIEENPLLKEKPFIHSSDAHYPEEIGMAYTEFPLQELSFETIREAIRKHIES